MRIKTKKLLPLVTLGFLITSCQNLKPYGTDTIFVEDRAPASDKPLMYFGLEQVDLKMFSEWSNGLFGGEKASEIKMDQTVNELILNSFYTSKDANSFLASVMGLKLHKKYSAFDSYRKLAEGLFSVRKTIRASIDKNNQYTRQTMLVLNILAEESLYVANKIYPDKKYVRFDYVNINIQECGALVGDLNGIKLCQGDILASKGSSGSSSFIARIADFPGNFSHSTIPLINEKNEILLMEADIDDGVKLRMPAKDYVDSRKVKLFVYRSKNPQTVKSANLATQRMYQKMKAKTGKADILKVASFDYDFTMNADDASKMFCSEIAYQTYAYNSVTAQDNPYPKKYWSKVTDSVRRDFLAKFLNSALTFPAPSDIEFNPNFEIVAMQFDTSKFSSDRIMVGLIDTLFVILNQRKDYVSDALKKLGNLGSEIATPRDIKFKLALLQKSGVNVPSDILSKVDSIPKNISYKQLIFFSFLNEKLAPTILSKMLLYEKELQSKGQTLDLVTMRAAMYDNVNYELEKFIQSISSSL